MALNFTTSDVVATGYGIKMLLYGSAGAGKTVACSTAPSPLIISAEAGLLSIRKKSIPVVTVATFNEVREALEWCKSDAKKMGIETICLDSISEITEVCLTNEKAKTKDPRAAYGEMANQIIKLVKEFRDLEGFHVVVTAKQTLATDPVTGAVKAAPTAPGQQVGQALPYLFDEVFHCFTDKDPNGQTYHALRTKAAFNAEAKDRSGVLDEIEYPDLSHLVTKMLST